MNRSYGIKIVKIQQAPRCAVSGKLYRVAVYFSIGSMMPGNLVQAWQLPLTRETRNSESFPDSLAFLRM